MAYPDFLLDKRVVGRNIAKGLVDTKTFEAHLKALPDVADNAEACSPEPDPVTDEESASPEG